MLPEAGQRAEHRQPGRARGPGVQRGRDPGDADRDEPDRQGALIAALDLPLSCSIEVSAGEVLAEPHDLVFRERETLTAGQVARTMVHAIDCEGGGSAARS